MSSRPSDDGSYDVPETFLNLDETTVPEPAERDPRYRQSLETARTPDSRAYDSFPSRFEDPIEHSQRTLSARPDSEAYPRNLNELTVLPPIRAERNARPERFAQLDEEKTETGDSIWRSPRRKQVSRIATQLYTISYLIFFSILGTLARLGLQALTFYPGAPVSQSVLWANIGGSLIMGFLAEDRQLFFEEWGSKKRTRKNRRLSLWKRDRELVKNSVPYDRTLRQNRPFATAHAAGLYPPRQVDAMPAIRDDRMSETQPPPSIFSHKTHDSVASRKRHASVKKTIPLYIGLSVGFCGSFTSFSSFQRDVFLALSNSAQNPDISPPHPRNGAYSFLALLGTLILTPALSLAALQVGAHLGLALESHTPSLSFAFVRKILDRAIVAVAWLSWLGAAFMSIWPPDRPSGPAGAATWAQEHWRGDALFALVFAPLGCLARFYLSLLLNGRVAAFPLGTFTANILGTCLEAAFYDIQHRPLGSAHGMVGGGRTACQLLQGAQDGFCGCLTTVSTWVTELNGLRRRHGYVYGAASLAAGLVAVVVIMGPVRWTGGGFAPTACGA